MAPDKAKKIILVSVIGMVAIVVAGDAVEGKTPTPKKFLALGFVVFMLIGGAEIAPGLAAAFAMVALTGVALDRLGPITARFNKVLAGGQLPTLAGPPATATTTTPVKVSKSATDALNSVTNPPTSTGKGDAIVKSARRWIGVPYLWGGDSPQGFDCSGLVQYVLNRNNIHVPRVAAAQFAASKRVTSPAPGDGVFFGSPVHHVGIVIGNGQMIDAPHTGALVRVDSYTNRKDIAGFSRFY